MQHKSGTALIWRDTLHQKRGKQSVRIRRIAGRQASRPLLISLKVRTPHRSMLKRTSGLYKLMSKVHRMSMKLESKFLDSLRIKTKTLQRNQSVRNVNNTPYTLENDMKNMVSCDGAAKATMQSMGSLELLLRASVFAALDLNEMGGTALPREPPEVLGERLSGLVSCGFKPGFKPRNQ